MILIEDKWNMDVHATGTYLSADAEHLKYVRALNQEQNFPCTERTTTRLSPKACHAATAPCHIDPMVPYDQWFAALTSSRKNLCIQI